MRNEHSDAGICVWCGEIILLTPGSAERGSLLYQGTADIPAIKIKPPKWVHKNSGLMFCKRDDEVRIAAYPKKGSDEDARL